MHEIVDHICHCLERKAMRVDQFLPCTYLEFTLLALMVISVSLLFRLVLYMSLVVGDFIFIFDPLLICFLLHLHGACAFDIFIGEFPFIDIGSLLLESRVDFLSVAYLWTIFHSIPWPPKDWCVAPFGFRTFWFHGRTGGSSYSLNSTSHTFLQVLTSTFRRYSKIAQIIQNMKFDVTMASRRARYSKIAQIILGNLD